MTYRSILLVLLLSHQAAVAAEALPALKLTDIAGQGIDLREAKYKATAVVFLGTECPIANKSIVKLNFLSRSFAKWNARVVGVISDPRVGRAEVQAWARDRGIAFPVIFDTSGDLAFALQPTHTPHAFVLNPKGEMVYSGRIDDAFPELGKEKHDADTYDLAAAVTDVLQGRPVKVAKTNPVGCMFEAWNNPRDEKAPVTFNRDIAPIVNANCVTCHRAGEVAPFPLTRYDDVAKRAKMVAAVTESRYMPPWKPRAGVGHFVGERRLTEREIALLQSWANAGAPAGDPADMPPAPQFPSGWRLGEPDLVVEMPDSLNVPANGPDIYRAFVMPLTLPEDTFVAAVEFRPGAPAVVHHALFFLDNTGTARRMDAADPLPGYIAFGGPGFVPTGGLGGWAPGAEPHRLPEGVGRPVAANSDLVMQVHYHPDGVERSDRSKLAIYLQKSPVSRLVGAVPLANRDIDIPPGDDNYIRTATMVLPVDATISALIPHMHLLGRGMSVSATTPDGQTIPLIQIDDWDFRWQDQYRFVEPINLPAGTKLEMSARFDNSKSNPNNPNDPPARVVRGEQTTDEMCVCFVEFLVSDADELRTLRRSVMAQRLGEAIRRRLGS